MFIAVKPENALFCKVNSRGEHQQWVLNAKYKPFIQTTTP